MNYNKKSELKGKRFKCLRIVKGLSLSDIPQMRENLQSQIDEIKGASMTETDTAFEVDNGQFFMKPVQEKEKIGILDCTRSFATFDGARIEYKDISNVFASSFETGNATYAIHATI